MLIARQGHSLRVSYSTKHILVYDPAIKHLGTYPNELKLCIHKNLHMGVDQTVLSVMAQTYRQPRGRPSADKESTLTLYKVEDSSVARANELSGHGREEVGNQIHIAGPSG